MASTQQPQTDFVKAISRLDATALVVGSMIGSGIFIVSAEILREVHAPGLLLVVWAGRVHFAQDLRGNRSEEHTSELQSHSDLVCRLLLEKKKPRADQGRVRTLLGTV